MLPPKFLRALRWQILQTSRQLPSKKIARKKLMPASCPWWSTATLLRETNDPESLHHTWLHSPFFDSEFCARRIGHSAQRFVRSDARALQGLQRRVREVLEGQNRTIRHHRAVAWRVEQTITGGH